LRTIYKYPLELTATQTIKMHVGANVLTAQLQNGIITLWVDCQPENKKEDRTFWIFGTGTGIPVRYLDYISTIQLHDYVWHIYEELPEETMDLDWPDSGGDLG